MSKVPHPAQYTDSFIAVFAQLLGRRKNVLDPFGGTGKLALVKEFGFRGKVICNEIEPEWANTSTHKVDKWIIGDAQKMGVTTNSISAICTSPTYGNRMADHHNARDNTRRITYKHYLGRDLDENNSGKMQWGDNYRQLHLNVYAECHRVLKKTGVAIINISNHIRKGEEIDVTGWHILAMQQNGFKLVDHKKIVTPRMRFGANSEKRIAHESILVFKK